MFPDQSATNTRVWMKSQGHAYISEQWQVHITMFICGANCYYAAVFDNKAALACYE